MVLRKATRHTHRNSKDTVLLPFKALTIKFHRKVISRSSNNIRLKGNTTKVLLRQDNSIKDRLRDIRLNSHLGNSLPHQANSGMAQQLHLPSATFPARWRQATRGKMRKLSEGQ
jgi:hypothetical protein